MSKCICCEKEFEYGGIVISVDGDFVCSEACRVAHAKELDHFCSVTLNNDTLFEEWLGLPIA
jgi:hypothetical protein